MKQKILLELVWHLCSVESEDVLHTLWGCDKLQPVWASEFGWVDRSWVMLGSFSKVLKLVQEKPHSVPLFVTMAWSIWYHWNKYCIQELSIPLERISSFSKDYIRDFKHLNNAPNNECWVAVKDWSVPTTENVKTNFDGALFGEFDEAGIGVVIRNCEGKVMAALFEKIKKPASVEILELLAARQAVNFTLDTGFNNSIFEMDSKMVVKSL